MNIKLKKNLGIFLTLITIGNLISFIMNPSTISDPKIWLMNCLFSIGLGWPMMKLNEIISRKYAAKIRWEINPLKRVAMTLGLVIVISILLTFLINYIFILTIQGVSFQEFIKTTMTLLVLEVLIVVYIFSVITGLQFFKMWKEGLIRQESLQRRALELQLESLKNQVNPHFLFNSLNTLTTLVHKEPDLAVKLIHQLSDSYRYLLEQKEKKTVAWAVERKFVENYLSLQQMRFSNNIRVELGTDGSTDFHVVPLSVQMMVENAIKHNVITAAEPLQIAIYQEGNRLVVRNNLQVKTSVVAGENIGLENVMQQYEILTQQKVEVFREQGFFFVKLPMIQKPYDAS